MDPVGSCVGTRGGRVQAVVDELGGEKIDIINWSEDPGKLISSALSPAKVEMVLIDEKGRSATVVVPDYQLSLAIGKEGQNVRLAAKLCSWKIDIKSHTQFQPKLEEMQRKALEPDEPEEEIEETVAEAVEAAEPAETAAELPNLKRFKKAELMEFAEANGIELDPKATNAAMIEAITEAFAK